ncbi:trifunctional serine/threonine-protein kinase/ATP-binding protein/SpoIIE family protein phosphatase [Eisenibacter elegans]|uniref:trifunctional serine/threonine-protein kinase/ATP-binding protein/SpoIIE family protein phosphatase n=1 Tax=Eisenibacter elegans TaxID=997 RepID=UPI0003FED68F|nr:AAA family ATPase [Eisenibacter elegans]
MQIAGYQVKEYLQQGNYTQIAEGFSGDERVILKISRLEGSYQDTSSSLYEEYQTMKSLEGSFFLRPIALLEHESKAVLVRDFFEGLSLKKHLSQKRLSIAEFFDLALQITDALIAIHQSQIIHKDLNPNNILYNPETGEIRVIDFGMSSRISLKSKNLGNPQRLEGTLSYMAPEQTGRMNRMVDHRSDLYSLGVTFYEMLSQRLPFEYTTAIELVHAHLALAPPPVQTHRSDVPRMLSEIVAKLLAKNAEDRYQSAAGLMHDLQTAKQYTTQGINPQEIKLGLRDISTRFVVPQKLHGRAQALDLLMQSFQESMTGQKPLVLVNGLSGVGKSALVAEVHKPMSEARGVFLEGKFDQFQRDVPYYAWQQVLNQLTELLLTEPEERLQEWQARLQAAVGSSGKVITELSPITESILGKQPNLPEVEANEAQNRFLYTLKNFIGCVAEKSPPLILFVDDWQWADLPSIALLQELLTDPGIKFLLVIAAYRDNEVSPTHSFAQLLGDLAKLDDATRPNIKEIKLQNLSEEDVANIIREAFMGDIQDFEQLSKYIYAKTRGNAFFVIQVLKYLYEEGILRSEYQQNGQYYCWIWENSKIQALQVSDNVVELMLRQIQKLPIDTQHLLQYASCLGNFFDIKVLSTLESLPLKTINQTLNAALQEGMLIPVDTGERFHTQYKFAHDRIRQAFYESVSEEAAKQDQHLRLATVLWEMYGGEQYLETHLFELVNQYNKCIPLLQTTAEKLRVAQLNLQAGTKARASAAYEPALYYTKEGVRLMHTIDGWQKHYSLTLALALANLQARYLTGDFANVEHEVANLLHKTQNVLDKVAVHELHLAILKAQNKLLEAIDVGLEALLLLNIKIPRKPSKLQIIWQVMRTKSLLSKPEKLLTRPQTDNPLHIAIERLLSTISPAAYFVNPDILPLIITTQAQAAYHNGHNLFSPYSYISFALIQSGVLNDIEGGYKLGKVAVELRYQLKSDNIASRLSFVWGCNVNHWKSPLTEVAQELHQTHIQAMQSGDFEFAMLSSVVGIGTLIFSGAGLNKVKERLIAQELVVKNELKQPAKHDNHLVACFLYAKASGDEGFLRTYEGHPLTEDSYIDKAITLGDKTSLFSTYVAKLLEAVLLNNHTDGKSYITKAEVIKDASAGTTFLTHFYYFKALILAQESLHNPSKAGSNKTAIVKSLKMLQKWAVHNPKVYAQKATFVQAMLAQLAGKTYQTARLFDQALQLANDHQMRNDQALIQEAFARFYLKTGQNTLADLLILQAYRSYGLWGAEKKTYLLEHEFKQLFVDAGNGQTIQVQKTTMGASEFSSQHSNIEDSKSSGGLQRLDIEVVIKSSQIISQEIVYQQLVYKMLGMVIANAGADKGALIISKGDAGLFLEAISNMNQESTTDDELLNLPLRKAKNLLPDSLINYALRLQGNNSTAPPTILTRPHENQLFSKDPYFQEHRPESVMMIALLKQQKLVGLLYLENSHNTGVFSQDRANLLALLSSQIAISIENAQLYENLEEKVKERTVEVMRQKDYIEEQKNEIEIKARDIKASINYAQNIQQAILPSKQELAQYLPESFVLFQPRDVVSGDFYWMKHVNGITFLAAVDCTGHGVPGAFMSLIGSSLLTEIVIQRRISSPGLILEELHKGIVQALHQEENKNRDGMDIALIAIDHHANTLTFAGAKNPLLIAHNGEMLVYKADKSPIGGEWERNNKERKFVQTVFSLSGDPSLGEPLVPQPSTTFYIFSDGYQDQFGGPNGRKLTSKGFRELLQKIHQKPVIEQKDSLVEHLEHWVQHSGKKESQLDDILIIGFRV